MEAFDEGAAAPVNLTEGPDGALYFPDLTGGKVWRIDYSLGNRAPHAVIDASPEYGLTPLEVHFNAGQSTDPDSGDAMTYAWDLDGDGEFDDSEAVSPTYTYSDPGVHLAKVKVTDMHDASDVASVSIQVGNTPPSAEITTPQPELTWSVGDAIPFSATASDLQDGALPASAFSWELIIHHCPSNCHEHIIETFDGVKSGTIIAPDHEYPSWLELDLKVVDSGGLTATDSVEFHPETVNLKLASEPAGLQLIANEGVVKPPGASVTVIRGSENTVIAPSPQTLNGVEYTFERWSDGGAPAHEITVGQAQVITAFFARVPDAPVVSATHPASPSSSRRPRISGSLAVRSPTTVAIFTNGNCSGAPAAKGPAVDFNGPGIGVDVPADATTSLSAMAMNVAGASPCSRSVDYTEDSTAPQTAIVSSPPAKQAVAVAAKRLKKPTRARARFAMGANEPVLRFECSIDKSAFAPCPSTMLYSRLKLGKHRFETRAIDSSGNVDATPAAKSFRVVRAVKPRNRPAARLLALPLDLRFN